MLGRNLEGRFEAKAMEIERVRDRLAVVALVDRQDGWLAGPADDFGDLLVSGDRAGSPVDHEHEQVGIGNGAMPALEYELVKWILARAEHAAGVDDREVRPLPLGGVRDNVASGA